MALISIILLVVFGIVMAVVVVGAAEPTSVRCGDEGAAYFSRNKITYKKYVDSELYAAAYCYVAESRCRNPGLPQEARGVTSKDSSRVKQYYGFNISHWCTGKAMRFDLIFYYLSVCSKEERGGNVES
jgi:hypothetical protein